MTLCYANVGANLSGARHTLADYQFELNSYRADLAHIQANPEAGFADGPASVDVKRSNTYRIGAGEDNLTLTAAAQLLFDGSVHWFCIAVLLMSRHVVYAIGLAVPADSQHVISFAMVKWTKCDHVIASKLIHCFVSRINETLKITL